MIDGCLGVLISQIIITDALEAPPPFPRRWIACRLDFIDCRSDAVNTFPTLLHTPTLSLAFYVHS